MVRIEEVRLTAGVLAACVGLALMAAGCSGKSSADGDDDASSGAGGTGASGGTSAGGTGSSGETSAGGTGGSSDAPPPAAMGVTLSLKPPSAASVPGLGGRTCNAGTSGAFTYAIGTPAPGETIEDGTLGVMVSCSVTAEREFNLMGSGVDANGEHPLSFTFTGTVRSTTDASQNAAAMTFFSPDTGHLSTLASFPTCTFGPVTVIKAGAILTDFDCPLIGALDDSTSGCAVHGTIAFEYCKTSLPTQ